MLIKTRGHGALNSKVAFAFIAVFSLLATSLVLQPLARAQAATNYNWQDRQTISVTGGNVKAGQTIHVDPNDPGPKSGGGRILTSESGTVQDCFLFICNNKTVSYDCYIQLTLKFSGSSSATISATKSNTPGISQQGAASDCSQDSTYALYNGKTVSISGTRPGDTNSTAETQGQRTTFFKVVSGLTPDQAPASITLTIVSTPSHAPVTTLHPSKYDLYGNVSYSDSALLDPGTYNVCASGIVLKTPCADFTKVKFQQTTVNLGDSEGAANRQIEADITIQQLGGAGATSVGPLKVILYDQSGSQQMNTADTNQVNIDNTAQSDSRTYYLKALLNNVDPGTYKLCIGTDQTICQTVVKEKDTKKIVNFTISGQQALDLIKLKADQASTCNIEGGIGWIVCPISASIAKGVDAIFNLVKTFLEFHSFTTDPKSGLYSSWAAMRNIANVAFVIVFMIIIFSQLSSVGISNYGIKKMLPRLIVAAILVNASYWICGIAVDLSNIIGGSISPFLQYVEGTIHGSIITVNWADAVGTVLAGTGVGVFATGAGLAAAGGAGALLWMAVPIVLAALFSVVVAFLILAARQVLIIILIVLSPLAFVAYLLPNTSKWFDKWKDALTTLLVMYPLIALIFAGAQLASAVVLSTGGLSMIQVIFALAIQVIPLAITPIVVKFSGGLLGKFAGIINNPNRGPLDRIRNYSKEKAELATKNGIANGTGWINRMGQRRDFRRRRDGLRGKQYEATSESNWQEHVAGDASLTEANNILLAQTSRGAEAQTTQKANYRKALGVDGSELLQTAAGLGGKEAATRIKAAVAAEAINEVKKAIENIEVQIDTEDIAALGKQMAWAIGHNDSLSARAYQNKLYTKGAAGIEMVGDVIEASEAAGMSAEMSHDLRTHTQVNHGNIKTSDKSQMKWATSNRTLAETRADRSTWEMPTNEFATQKAYAQKIALGLNTIDKATAKELLDNPNQIGNLDPDVKRQLRDIANS